MIFMISINNCNNYRYIMVIWKQRWWWLKDGLYFPLNVIIARNQFLIMLVTLPLDIEGDIISSNPNWPWHGGRSSLLLLKELSNWSHIERCILTCGTFRILPLVKWLCCCLFSWKQFSKVFGRLLLIWSCTKRMLLSFILSLLVLIFCCFCKVDYCVQVAH